MTKTVNAKNSDPLAAVRVALVEGVDTLVANNAKVVDQIQAELIKAKTMATENAKQTHAAVQANVDAVNAASKVVAAGAEKAGALVQGEVTNLVDGRVAALKAVFGAANPKEFIDAQVALVKAEQANATAFVDTFFKLGQTVANDALKPVQAQVADNLKALNIKAA